MNIRVVPRAVRRLGLSAVAAGLLGVIAAPAGATTEVPLWHALSGHNADVLQSLVRDYNRSQDDVAVRPRAFDSAQALSDALDQAARDKRLPALAQIGDSRTLIDASHRPYVQPFHVLQKQAGLAKVPWFVSSDNAFVRDGAGRLMAFPFMLEVPVMYYNQDAFKRAGLGATVPGTSWMSLQDQLVDMANHGSRQCPLTSNLPVSVNLENLAAVNNRFYASGDNGLQTRAVPQFAFDSAFVRHLALMISWVKAGIMVGPASSDQSVARFARGECAVLLSGSGHIGEFNSQRRLHYAVRPLPFYPQVTTKPGHPFVSGAGLWVMKTPAATQTATAQFLAWLAQPKPATRWYQQTGYLPLTKAAFEAGPAPTPGDAREWQALMASYAQPSVVTARGFRINNYGQIRLQLRRILDGALAGQAPAVTALGDAARTANTMVRQKTLP